MPFLVDNQWTIFIVIEVLSIVSLLLFGFLHYVLMRRQLSVLAIFAFLVLLISEALLAVLIYQETKEIETFQIAVGIFVVYACTFGILDFLKLDRWMRKKVGKWRRVELLTKKDYDILQRERDPKHVAKKYRLTSVIHLALFVVVQSILWMYGTESFEEWLGFMSDLSWIENGTAAQSPYPNEITYNIGVIWGLVFIVDFIYSWSYTIFPSKPKK